MCELPDFLEPILELVGKWEDIEQYLYNIFKQDFIDEVLFLETMEIVFDRRKGDNDKEIIFWHLITKKNSGNVRLADYRRAERLHWNRPIIENYNDPIIKDFKYLEGSGKIRRYLWVENFQFCVVLEPKEQKNYCVLITAFFVDHLYKRTLRRKYNKRITNTA
jgi:hypothetical protein